MAKWPCCCCCAGWGWLYHTRWSHPLLLPALFVGCCFIFVGVMARTTKLFVWWPLYFLFFHCVIVDMMMKSVLGRQHHHPPSITNYIDNSLFVGVGTGVGGALIARTTKLFVWWPLYFLCFHHIIVAMTTTSVFDRQHHRLPSNIFLTIIFAFVVNTYRWSDNLDHGTGVWMRIISFVHLFVCCWSKGSCTVWQDLTWKKGKKEAPPRGETLAKFYFQIIFLQSN